MTQPGYRTDERLHPNSAYAFRDLQIDPSAQRTVECTYSLSNKTIVHFASTPPFRLVAPWIQGSSKLACLLYLTEQIVAAVHNRMRDTFVSRRRLGGWKVRT